MPKSKSTSKKSKKQSEASKLSIKEKLAQKQKAIEARKKLIRVISTGIILGLVLAIPLSIIDLKMGLGAGLVAPIILFSYQYPRMGLWAFSIYMPFSGTVTYWVGGGIPLFQLSKDVFYLSALLGLIQECRRKKQPILIPKKLLLTLSILFIFSLMVLFFVNGIQQFLPNCSNVTNQFLRNGIGPCKDGIPFLQGVLGLKVLLGYVPLIFCAYYLIENKKQLLFLGRLLVVLAIICCVLGLVQYWMLDTGRCAGTRGLSGDLLFKASLKAKCLVGGSLLFAPSQGQIRLPGTFVSPWHWAWFLIANSALTFTTAFGDPSRFWRLSGLAGMALVFINAVICGQRIALALVPVVILTLLILTGQIANLKRFVPIAVGLGLALLLFVGNNPDFVQQRVDSLVGRWNAAPPYAFMQQQFKWAIEQQRGVLGRGLGKGTNSTRTFGKIALIETFHPKLLYEMGYFGTLAFLAFVTNLTVLAFQDYRSVKDKNMRIFGSSFWVFILIISYFPYWYPLDTDPVAVYYWFLAGVIFKLPAIDRAENLKLKESPEQETENTESQNKRSRRRRRASNK